MPTDYDILIIGGGINGCGIARDAAGRGYSVCLCEAGDLGSGTSSASTKLVHGGLRYLEHYEFNLVRKALIEREVIWKMAPHIVHPLRFILPHHKGLRPKWLLRLGLFLYDYMGGRKLLPPTKTVNLKRDETGKALKPEFEAGFEYSDCWVNDSRLVVLNAVDAENKGAKILSRTKVTDAQYSGDHWQITCENTQSGKTIQFSSKMIINAAGPWVDEVLCSIFGLNDVQNVRLVRGSHIVINKKFQHDKCYIFQYSDGRIVFAIPYEDQYTLIGTTDAEHENMDEKPQISPQESEYLCQVASDYFREPVTQQDIVWTYSGVRPLYDDGASEAQEATRDYVLAQEKSVSPAPLINIFGGKITTYRILAEAMLEKIASLIGKKGKQWTADTHLPGGDFAVGKMGWEVEKLHNNYPFLDKTYLARLMRTYGTCSHLLLEGVKEKSQLGEHFGGQLFQREVEYLIDHEWACSGEDILFRRTKQGIQFNAQQTRQLARFVQHYVEAKSGKVTD